MLDHEEEALSVDLACVDFGLQSAHLVAPGHGLSLDPVGAELHETLIECIENPLIVNMDTFLGNRVPYFMFIICDCTEMILFSLPFDVQVEVYGEDWKAGDVHSCLKVLVGTNF